MWINILSLVIYDLEISRPRLHLKYLSNLGVNLIKRNRPIGLVYWQIMRRYDKPRTTEDMSRYND